MSYTEEEHAAVGTGDAAKAAVESFGLAAMTREEGRRLDTIVGQGMNALVRACELHEKMAAVLLRERMQDSAQNRALMESVRVHFLARTEAEADLQSQRAEAPKDQLSEIVAALLPALVSQLASKPEKPPGKG